MSYELTKAISAAKGLTPDQSRLVCLLLDTWHSKLRRNTLRDRYYLGHVSTKELGIAISREMGKKVNARVDWPAKAVDYLAARSQFDGFTASDEDVSDSLLKIAQENDLKTLYRKALTCELKHCCCAWTVTSDGGRPVISAYPMTAAALLWDSAQKEVACGLVVAESKKRPNSETREPTLVKVFLKDSMILISRSGFGNRWVAQSVPHSMGRTLIEPMAYHPTLERPFGRSRITRAVMSLTDDALRAKENSVVAAEFAAYPQKYLLGTDSTKISKENKYAAYIGAILEVTKGEGDSVPSFGQLPQISMQPHVDYMRSLAAQFSGATNVPLSALGVVSDNPSSAEAIYAAKEDMVIDAQALNNTNGRALVNVAMMALAIDGGSDFATVRDANASIEARFRNPAMPSVVSQSDAMVKQISAIPWIAESDVALEELGYSEEQILRLRSDRAKVQSRELVASVAAASASTSATTGEAPKPDAQQGDSSAGVGRALNGAQTQSLISVLSQYSSGSLTEGQAVNLISTAIGMSKDEARNILNGA